MLKSIRELPELSHLTEVSACLEINNTGDLAFLSLNQGVSPIEEYLLPDATQNYPSKQGKHRLIPKKPLLYVQVGQDVCETDLFLSSVELQRQSSGFEFHKPATDKRTLNMTWEVLSKREFTWTQGKGALLSIRFTQEGQTTELWLLRLNCCSEDSLVQDLSAFGMKIHRLYWTSGAIRPQAFYDSVDQTIPYVVGKSSPRVNGGQGFGSVYDRISTVYDVFINGEQFNLYIAKGFWSTQRMTWKTHNDLEVYIRQSPQRRFRGHSIHLSTQYILSLNSDWTLSWQGPTRVYDTVQDHVQMDMPEDSVQAIVENNPRRGFSLMGDNIESLKEFGFVTDIPNRLVLPLADSCVMYRPVGDQEWVPTRLDISLESLLSDEDLIVDPNTLLIQDETAMTPSVLTELPDCKEDVLSLDNDTHLAWLKELFAERWVVYPKCGSDLSEIAVFEDVANVFVRVDLRTSFYRVPGYDIEHRIDVLHTQDSIHPFLTYRRSSLKRLQELDLDFTSIFRHSRCHIAIFKRRTDARRIAVVSIGCFAQQWLNLCFLNGVRPFAACLPRHGFDGDKERGDFFTDWFASEFSKNTKYIISNISFVEESTQESSWRQWSRFGGYVRGNGGQHRVSRRLYVNEAA